MLKAIESTQPLTDANKDGASNRLKGITEEFESIFLTYMLKSMRAAFAGEGITGKSNESKIINAMLDENLALDLSRGGGIGLGKVLFERLGGASGVSSQKDETAREKGRVQE